MPTSGEYATKPPPNNWSTAPTWFKQRGEQTPTHGGNVCAQVGCRPTPRAYPQFGLLYLAIFRLCLARPENNARRLTAIPNIRPTRA